MSLARILLISIVTLAFTTEAAIGFGATLITISLGSLLSPLDELLYAVVPLNALLSATVALRARRHIDARMLFLRIVPAMALGLPIGMFAFARFSGGLLQRLLGVFVLVLAALELAKKLRRPPLLDGAPTPGVRSTEEAPLPRAAALAMLFLGGVVHGAFATGGPPVVYVCGRIVKDKRVFRGTLSALWLLLNGVLIVTYARGGHLDAASLSRSAWLAPGLVLGLVFGEIAHGRIPEKVFRAVVFAMLAGVGLVLAIRG